MKNSRLGGGVRFGWVVVVAFVALAGAIPGIAQTAVPGEAEALREELRAMKAEYEQRIRQMEERLERLEAPAAVAAAPAPAAAAEPAPAESKAVTDVVDNFVDIHGYIRAGYGQNDRGSAQTGFKAPGAGAKYRLGNEAETYGELILGKDVDLSGNRQGPVVRTQLRLSVNNPYQDQLNSDETSFGLPEAWASIANVMSAQPGMAVWAGSRFYRRQAIDINDYYYYNMSGTGGGVEDVELGFGKLALAWIGAGSSSGISSAPEPDPENKAGFSKMSWDLRLYDVAVPLGKGEFGLAYSRADGGVDAIGQSAPDSDGVAVTFLHVRDHLVSPDGANKFSLQFGTGAAKTFTSGFEYQVLDGASYIRPDQPGSWRFRATEHFVANLGDAFSIAPALVYELTDYDDESGKVHWASAGVRPVWYFARHLSLAAEAGVDWVKDEGAGTSDSLVKFTLAPQVAVGRGFASRPALRLYATYARWGDDFVGQIGGLDYADKNDGFVYGIQMESWW